MDAKSKKSSLTSGSVYMSANEIELGSMKESSSDLNKQPPKSDSHTEKIDEVNEETTNVAVVSFVEEGDDRTEPNEQDTLLQTPEAQIPISASQEIRSQEIETTFTVQPDLDSSEEEIETLLNHPNNEEQRSPAADVLLRMRELFADYAIFIVGAFFLLLFFIFLVGILPHCFHSLYYDEYALSKSSLTGKVDDKEVYGPGWHFMSPFNEWIKFRKTEHTVRIMNVEIYTTDQLMVRLSMAIYYFLDKKNIGKLYRTLGSSYVPTIYNVCKSEMINLAHEFSIVDFRTRRAYIKTYLKKGINKKLKEKYGINLFDVFLEQIQFDKTINNINLKNVMNDIYNEKAMADKDTAVAYQETKVIVKRLQNEARAVTSVAKLNSTYEVLKIEKAQYDRVIELTHCDGLSNNYKELGFDSQVNKISFCWMNQLVYNEKIRFHTPTAAHTKGNDSQALYSSLISLSL